MGQSSDATMITRCCRRRTADAQAPPWGRGGVRWEGQNRAPWMKCKSWK
jgi:hypothetical protein